MNLWGKTDIGLVRPVNQDAFVIHKDGGDRACFAVCDGMGGAKAGHVASRLAVETFGERLRAELAPGLSAAYIKKLLCGAAEEANGAVFSAAEKDEAYAGMGTTLVGGVISGRNAAVVNVGDSRCYLIDRDGIRRITRDHSLVEELLYRGKITEAEAIRHPNKNFITRALGAERQVEADVYPLSVAPGQFLLLCSDGLTNEVTEQEILYEVLHGGAADGACSRLIQIANQRGGHDNITVLLIEI